MENKMKITKWALNGFILLAASISLFTTPILATPILEFHGQSFDIAGGGQFLATLSTDPNTLLKTYCVDFANEVNPDGGKYAVNISTLSDLSNTRFGNTAQSAFTFQNAPAGTSLGSAANRYAEAAWLIGQFDLTPGANNNAKDIGIQSAIWNLLDVTGQHNTQGDWQTWMNNAATSGGSSNFQIFTTTDVASASGNNRYNIGGQEMIVIGGTPNISQTPEPQSAVMIGLGGLLIGLGVIKRRKVSASQDLA